MPSLPLLNRRRFIKNLAALGASQAVLSRLSPRLLAATSDSTSRSRPPYRVIYSNDTTNITTCVSPFRAKGQSFKPEMLEATVDEVAGRVDAHFIQLAHGQVPWYPSKVYPLEEHHRWWQQHFGVSPNNDAFNVSGIHRFILDGGDPLKVFIDRCRQTGQAPFISMRLNDVHHVEHVNTPGNLKGIHSITRFYAEHPEWRIGTDLNSWSTRTLNWAVPQVRDNVFAFIAEQCRNYDIDGFELDFLRHPNFFRLNETTFEERRRIMGDFIRKVRAVLDERSPRRWLSVRISCYISGFDSIGIDLREWVDSGVDIINLSPHYFTVQQTDLVPIRAMVPDAAIYQEMCHSIWNGPRVADGYDAFTFRRATPEQYETTAHLAYERGAAGVSLFNFAYYREHGRGERGPFNEPPFEVLGRLRDPSTLARRPQHWFVATGWPCPFGGVRVPMPRMLSPGGTTTFDLDLAPPAGGWTSPGRLRLQGRISLGDSRWSASINGKSVSPTDDRSEPYPNPYPPLLGQPEEMRAWTVPASLLRPGMNQISFTLETGTETEIVYIDLGIQ